MTYKVLDTNIILLDANNIFALGGEEVVLVLPETVIDEIDSKKSGHSEIAYQARQFGRLLTKATRLGTEFDYNGSGTIITKLQIDKISIWVVSLEEYPDYSDTEPNIINDRKIIEVAKILSLTINDELKFVTNDVMCGLRAEALGLYTESIKVTDNVDLEFIKEFEVDQETFRALHRKSIVDVDSSYKPENFNYKFTCQEIGQMKLATINNGVIDIIGKETEVALRRQDVNPVNAGQLFLSKAIQDTSINIVVCEAKAGSGKTLVALSNSIRSIKVDGYQSIIYIRASIDDVPKEEEIGFLSGNDEKVEVYLHPLEDSLDFIIRNRFKVKKGNNAEFEEMIAEKISNLKSECNIKGMIGLGMRGRTFNDSIVIIDETQNMSKSSLQKVLTRIGKNSKVILIGSNNQIDNPYVTKHNNGLSYILDACTHQYNSVTIHAVHLDKVVRSNIAEFAEELFSKGE